jgi:hypothetical protein
MGTDTVADLVLMLGSFDRHERREALEKLAPGVACDPKPIVNLHCHTFYSYNGYGYSPSRFAWEACKKGLEVAAIVDFDVLDGVGEFLSACRLLGIKCAAGIETRAFVAEYADCEVNSPHEPGVLYMGGMGFTGSPEAGTKAESVLLFMAGCAERRNREMIARVNAHLDPVVLDYEADVLPLTPSGNATERHMLAAYVKRAQELMPEPDERGRFWAEKLAQPEDYIAGILDDIVNLKGVIRTRLMKYGGVGYVPPGKGDFPKIEDVVTMTLECGAVPTICWLDGLNEGEADPYAHFELMKSMGIPTVTVIPDRNWDIKNATQQRRKVAALHKALAAATDLQMPVFVGTEMNKYGQKFVDAFDAPALAAHREQFLSGAAMIWGHTLLKMTMGLGFIGAWADEYFGDDTAARVSYFRQVGECPFPDREMMRALAAEGARLAPDRVLAMLTG